LFFIFDAPPACSGLYKAIISEVALRGVQVQWILPKMCMCRVKLQY